MSNEPMDKDPEHVIRFTRIVRPGEAPEVVNSPFGLMVNDEHGVTTYRPDGSVLIHHPDESIEARKPAVDRIVVSDLRGVAAHRVNQVYDTSSHVLEFVDGGTFSCVYDTKHRTLMETRQRGIMSKHTSERLLILQPDMTMPEGDEAYCNNWEFSKRPEIKPDSAARLHTTERSVIVDGDNGVSFYRDDGCVAVWRPSGSFEMTHPGFRRIEITDLELVASHGVEHLGETSLHSLLFKGGGSFSCVFGATGKALGLQLNWLVAEVGRGVLFLKHSLEKPEDREHAR